MRKRRPPRVRAASSRQHGSGRTTEPTVPRGLPQRRIALGVLGLGVVTLAVVTALLWPAARRPPDEAATAPPPPEFVGHDACVPCHRTEAEAWKDSQHAHAMQPATPATVLGNFDDATVTYDGVTSTFFRRDDRFFVRTDGPDGALADFEVKYTFGVYPLQQYLVPFPDGRMQALSIAWDARPQQAGGGRWFHLYPDEHIDHRDPLHWTRLEQNWNYMCADCHSTNLRRNYDPVHDRYATTWSDLAVGCEACHGPGSNHVAWAEKRPGWEKLTGSEGLTIPLDERRGVRWTIMSTGNATRSRPLETHREVETCGVCHARRSPLGVDPNPTGRLLDTHDLALLEARLYHPDGQQLDEVYTYGSFLQSRMYAKGVTCSDCHDPHTQRLRAPGNAVCAQCHSPAMYETPAHLLHPAGSPGAQCAECHMPTRSYMVIDPRRDHSIRIPRPDLTVRHGVPNACGSCHADRDAGWAAAAIEKAYGPGRKGFQTFVDALHAGRIGEPGAREKLSALVRDAAAPGIARATAVAALEGFPGRTALDAIQLALGDRDTLVREAALGALLSASPPVRGRLAEPLADDPVKAVRVKAGRVLAGVPMDALSPERRARCERAVTEYVASQEALAERPEAHLDLGIVYADRGDATRAEAEYRAAIRLQPDFVPAYANLADLYRALGREADAASALADGLKAVPDDPSLVHALGLKRVREKRVADALPLLERAALARPENARFAYVHAVALESLGRRDEAIAALTRALERSPYDPDLLFGLSTFNREAGHLPEARDYARRLGTVAPDDERVLALLRELDGN
ncbi:MAG: tetratricopeptide repeat protein [Deltaproteobacteria bacterium]|nr:MAG: tetratricopeptide repeat protein [Deltaproteobacteria bacterium]